jgi:lysozyme
MNTISGIDVSHHQEKIDWKKVKNSDIDFVMIKATEGVDYIDPLFQVNAREASAAGLHMGAYHLLRTGDPQKQAKQLIASIDSYQWDYPIACDVEHNELLALGKNKLTDMVCSFCEAVKAEGYYPIVYANLNWCKNYLDMTRLKAYDLWLARYAEKPGYDGVSIWQYSSSGSVVGISGNVDMNISYKDYSIIISVSKTIVQIDTTIDIDFSHGEYYKVKTISPKPVTITAGTAGVVTIVPFPCTGSEQLFAIVAIGQSGQETGIYTSAPSEKPMKRFIFKIKEKDTD